MTEKRQRFYARNAVNTTLDSDPLRRSAIIKPFDRFRPATHCPPVYVVRRGTHCHLGIDQERTALMGRLVADFGRNCSDEAKILDLSKFFLSPLHYCIAVWPN